MYKRRIMHHNCNQSIDASSSIETMSSDIFKTLAQTFPISCASDEFYFFPQIRLAETQWEVWDGYSKESIAELVRRISRWENELDQRNFLSINQTEKIDIALLKKLIRTLGEQLSEVRMWEYQPSFYLTLSCIGLAEAIESTDSLAIQNRIKTLPAFLDQACQNLDNVPILFRDIGLEMIADTRDYYIHLAKEFPELNDSLTALDRFDEKVRHVSTRKDFLLPKDLVKRIVYTHINCGLDIHDIHQILDREIDDMRHILNQEAKKIIPEKTATRCSGSLWSDALKRIPTPFIGKAGVIGLYQNEVKRLTEHCIAHGLASPELAISCPVHVSPMPPFLSAIRASSSYSIRPEYPSSGGTFYIISRHEDHREYRMLAAHETYPGHHLLDASRWNLTQSCRRAIEQPIFYEGWACFAEELLRVTGYFSTPADRLLLAKRRLWRAIRGKVDLGLQIGTIDLKTAARHLRGTGITIERALSSARKYPLNPGYQLCYSIGLHTLMNMFHRYGSNNLNGFIHTILHHGEINFIDLEKLLKKSNSNYKNKKD